MDRRIFRILLMRPNDADAIWIDCFFYGFFMNKKRFSEFQTYAKPNDWYATGTFTAREGEFALKRVHTTRHALDQKDQLDEAWSVNSILALMEPETTSDAHS